LGVGYAYFTDVLTIESNIDTGNMDYTFSIEGDTLNVSLDYKASNTLWNMKKGDKYTIEYTVDSKDADNVSLKKIDNKWIASVTINRASFLCKQNGLVISPPASVVACIPTSLGSYECYHNFDGKNGTITLVKAFDSDTLTTTVDKDSLTQDDLSLLNITSELEENVVAVGAIIGCSTEDDSDSGNITGDATVISEAASVEEASNTENTEVEYETVITTVASIKAEGTYQFSIPLIYDQYNVK
jgi:hypothetical protein